MEFIYPVFYLTFTSGVLIAVRIKKRTHADLSRMYITSTTSYNKKYMFIGPNKLFSVVRMM